MAMNLVSRYRFSEHSRNRYLIDRCIGEFLLVTKDPAIGPRYIQTANDLPGQIH